MAAETATLTVISYPARPPKLPLWLALDAGLFEKNGLKVTLKELDSSEELIRSMQSATAKFTLPRRTGLCPASVTVLSWSLLPTPATAF